MVYNRQTNEIRKKSLFVVAIAALSMSMFLTSCNGDGYMCTCKESHFSTAVWREYDPASYGAANCSDLEVKLTQSAHNNGYSYNCSEKE